jgi:hypothetical protein
MTTSNLIPSSVRTFSDLQALAFLAAFTVHWKAQMDTPLEVTHGVTGFGAREQAKDVLPADEKWVAFRSTGRKNTMEPVFSTKMWLAIILNPSELKDFVMKEIFVSETGR